MELLYAEAAACTQGEERVRILMESIRLQATDATTADRLELATKLAQQAIFELETRAVEVDALLEANTLPPSAPFICQPLTTLEALDKLFATQWEFKHLKKAIKERDDGSVDLLIQAGVDPSAENNRAIQFASDIGNLAAVNRLLQDERVDPSANNNVAIQWASDGGHLAIVNRLLEDERVDPTATNNSAIHYASLRGHLSVVNRLLQDERVDPSANGNWAIRDASQEGHLPVVNRLLQDSRVDPSARANSAIRWAHHYKHLPVVERLLQDERVSSTLTNQQLADYFYSSLSPSV